MNHRQEARCTRKHWSGYLGLSPSLHPIFIAMGRRHRNPLFNPLHYATPQLPTGPPVTWTAAQRGLVGYDYGTWQCDKIHARR